MGSTWALVRGFFPPDLSPHYLLALVEPVVESLGMTAAAMFIAYAVSLPLGLAVGMRVPGAGVILGALRALRAIPDLTMAIFCVILVGIGTGAGTLGLAIFYTAATAKIFGDLFRTAPQGPIVALGSTGASRLQIALFGLLPLKRSDLLTYGSYEFESAVRCSVIVGAVGGGGLGAELVGTLAALDFQRAATLILVLVAVIASIDHLTVWLRRDARWLAPLLALGAVALWFYGPRIVSLSHAARTFASMLPPRLGASDWAKLPRLVFETFGMALIGTLLAVVVALPLGLLSARNLSVPLLGVPTRRLLELLRSIPELVWGLMLIAVAGVGAKAGALALGLHSMGSLGRLFAESVENVPRQPMSAIAATGASRVAIAGFAALPLAAGPLAVHSLFRFEWNLRMATVMGVIGAGGVGQALYEAQQLFFYRQMMAYILITWAIVAVVDRASERTRERFGLSYLPH